MWEIVGLIVAFALIFALRFRGVDFSVGIFAASAVILLTSGKPLGIFSDVLVQTLRDYSNWELCAAVALITVLSYALKETNMMVELIEKLRGFIPSRVLLAVIPALFGILSMPGGALMSCPFNEPEADRLELKPEQKTFVNVWFRHVWFWASPISPSTVLAVALAGFSLTEFIVGNFYLFAICWGLGFVWSWKFTSGDGGEKPARREYGAAARLVSPIIVTVALSVIGVPIWIALFVGIGIIVFLGRVKPRRAWLYFKKGVKWDIVAAVFSTFFFRYALLASGSATSLFNGLLGSGVSLLVILITVPILMGAISGTATMGIGMIFPLLLPLIPNLNLHSLTIVFAGVVLGYTISPLHLCLMLTNEYYKSELPKVYKYLVPPLVVLYIVAIASHFMVGGGL
jgi:integral membrane protein (TIGR00529 family)